MRWQPGRSCGDIAAFPLAARPLPLITLHVSALTCRVFWGTIGPQKQFGAKGQYKALLIGFPAGVAISLGMFSPCLGPAPR
jgi:hypothetical protein